MTTHSHLVKKAIAWLRQKQKCSIVFAETTSSAAMEIPDVIGWTRGVSHVVECKASRSDFLRELKKYKSLFPDTGMGRYRWFLCPAEVIVAEEVPVWYGLLYLKGRSIVVVKEAVSRDKWDATGDALVLTGAIRRLELGVSFNRKLAKFESYLDFQKRTKEAVLPSPLDSLLARLESGEVFPVPDHLKDSVSRALQFKDVPLTEEQIQRLAKDIAQFDSENEE